MPGGVKVKVCGVKTAQDVAAAAASGAAYIGFNFFDKSPRSIDLDTAAELALAVPLGICKVALLVDPDDEALDALLAQLPVDMIQLHGSETPERVAEIRSRSGLPVMKAVGIADEEDLSAIEDYAKVADQILVDAKPPRDATLPGGNGLSFDWRLLDGRRWPVPWMLAGGLTPSNVAEAIARTGARQVDVASGVESAPGQKDARRIADFIAAAQSD